MPPAKVQTRKRKYLPPRPTQDGKQERFRVFTSVDPEKGEMLNEIVEYQKTTVKKLMAHVLEKVVIPEMYQEMLDEREELENANGSQSDTPTSEEIPDQTSQSKTGKSATSRMPTTLGRTNE